MDIPGVGMQQLFVMVWVLAYWIDLRGRGKLWNHPKDQQKSRSENRSLTHRFYYKMDGIDGRVGQGGLNEEETEQMREALIDLSNRIRRAAENILARLLVGL